MFYDPIEIAAKGATEGFLNWGEEFVKKLASKFKDRKLAFIQDEKTIKLVKEQYNSGELSFYKEYIGDKEMLFLLKMGLTLRGLEKEKEEERKQNLRTKIFNRYQIKGLHIAQFVENGILNRYIGILIDDIISLAEFKKDIINILKNIEKHVLFVKREDMESNNYKTNNYFYKCTSSHDFYCFWNFFSSKISKKLRRETKGIVARIFCQENQ